MGAKKQESDIFSLRCVFLEITDLLASDANLGALDPRAYWQRVDDVQSALVLLSTSDSRRDKLFLVCRDMLELSSEDRIEAKGLLRRMLSIQNSRSDPVFELLFQNFVGFAPSTSQNAMDEDEIVVSDRQLEASYQILSTREENERLPNDPAFSLFHPRRSILIAIRSVARKPLIKHEGVEAYFYIFWQLRNPSFIKIGYAKDVPMHLKQWKRGCKHRIQVYEQQTTWERALVTKAPRVEKLVATELMDVRFKENHCGGCNATHFEWYRTTPEHAAQVIKKFSDWMAISPYQFDRTSNEWKLDERAWMRYESMAS